MTEEDAKNYKFNPFDLTRVWLKKDYPLIEVGEFELNRNPENYFADVEQAAFNPASVVPGISFSPDKMLQGRLFSYGDAQRYRLGVNHNLIPVNAPKCTVNSYHRDGTMRVDSNAGATIGTSQILTMSGKNKKNSLSRYLILMGELIDGSKMTTTLPKLKCYLIL